MCPLLGLNPRTQVREPTPGDVIPPGVCDHPPEGMALSTSEHLDRNIQKQNYENKTTKTKLRKQNYENKTTKTKLQKQNYKNKTTKTKLQKQNYENKTTKTKLQPTTYQNSKTPKLQNYNIPSSRICTRLQNHDARTLAP
jgi:hypothetical protein